MKNYRCAIWPLITALHILSLAAGSASVKLVKWVMAGVPHES